MRFKESNLRTSGFSWQNMLSLALVSKYSYQDKEQFEKIISSGWDVEISANINIRHTQGYLLENDAVAILVYRGTESIGDWLINMRILDERGAFGDVHSGFRQAFQSTKDIIIPKLEAASRAGKTIWLTGHSLGGAIALNTAIESFGSINLAGIATFGQPRIAKLATAQKIDESFKTSYFRFVNNDDVVPRVPMLYSHAGQLFQFDGYGDIENNASENVYDGNLKQGRPPLKESEFESLRAEIQKIKDEVSNANSIEGSFADFFSDSLEGLLPSFFDHRIDQYISAISRYLPKEISSHIEGDSISAMSGIISLLGLPKDPAIVYSSDDQMDSSELDSVIKPPAHNLPSAPSILTRSLEALAGGVLDAEFTGIKGMAPEPQETAYFPFLLEVSRHWQPPEGLKICSQFQNIATVLASEEQVNTLNNDNAISSIEFSRDAGITELDDSVSFVGGDVVHRPHLEERGDAAIIGIIDTGIDILHNAFMKSNTTETRILGIWDQGDRTGPTPKAVNPHYFTQDFGTLHTKANLQDVIDKYHNHQTSVPYKLRDPSGHGTHVTSIAAGSATDTLAPGMAPEANVLAVIPHLKQEAGSPRSIGYSNSHVDALSFLTAAAAGNNVLVKEKMPIAINVSLGMNAGAHDGTTLLEAAFDSATNLGRERGVVIVKSAGNERVHAGHASIQAVHQGVVELTWHSSNRWRHEDYFEGWFHEADTLSFVVVDPQGNRSQEVTFENKITSDVLNGNICTMTLTDVHRDNGAHRLTLSIVPETHAIQEGQWKLEVIGQDIASETGMLNMWVERNNNRPIRFDIEDIRMTLSVPGTAQTVVTVGATDTSIPWRLNDSSSYGPTRTGQKKPDICAPGFQIKAAHANQDDHNAVIEQTGTSMAAPHVTGAIALALSKVAKTPGLEMPNAQQIASQLRRTVQGGRRAHHPGAGFGLLDTEAFFNEVVRTNKNN